MGIKYSWIYTYIGPASDRLSSMEEVWSQAHLPLATLVLFSSICPSYEGNNRNLIPSNVAEGFPGGTVERRLISQPKMMTLLQANGISVIIP